MGADPNGEILGRACQSHASTSDTALLRSLLIATAARDMHDVLQLHLVQAGLTSCLVAGLTDSSTSGTALGLRSKLPQQRVTSLCENQVGI